MKTARILDDLFGGTLPGLPTPRAHVGGLVGVGFAGGGGASKGVERAGLRIDFAMNHDAAAIAMHAANCPGATHYLNDIWRVRPERVRPGEPIRFMWFSPDCTHFSIAKGGTPLKKEIRDLAWVMLLWAKLRRPDVFVMENVREIVTWGPLDADGYPIKEREGEYWRAFLREWRKLGYVFEFKKLLACDYGDPTSRWRLFGQFRCDGQTISWPEPTHGDPKSEAVMSGALLPWVPAAAILDFTQPCYSIFMTREEARANKVRVNRPLVDATFARLTLGLQRWVLEADRAYVVKITNASTPPSARMSGEPLWTQTASGAGNGGEHALAVPSLIPVTHQGDPRAHSVEDPTKTMTAANRGEIALGAAFISSVGGGEYAGRPRSADKPLNVMTQENRQVVAAAYLTKFRKDNEGGSVEVPAPTMTANSYIERPGGAAPIGLVASYLTRYHGPGAGGDLRGSDLSDPHLTDTAGGNRTALIAAHIVQHNAGPNNGGLAGRPVDDPISTLQTSGSQQNLVTSHLVHFRGGGDRRGNSVEDPAVAQTAGGTHLAEVRTFLVKYYKSAVHGQPSADPLHSITTKARFALVEVSTADVELTEEQRYTAYWVARMIDVYGYPNGKPKKRRSRKGWGSLRFRTLIDRLEEMHQQRPSAVGRDGWIVWDVGMRMLTVRERFRAQGVGDDFIIDVDVDGKRITATKQGEMCGNMVCPGVAEAIVRAALPELREPAESVAA